MTKVTCHSIPLEYLYPQSFFERSDIHTYSDTVPVFVERKNYDGVFLPTFERSESSDNTLPIDWKC